jgi:REP element-mobilizing transposase RayT
MPISRTIVAMTAWKDHASHRLACYDYAWRGTYFVTAVTAKRRPIFGALCDGLVELTPEGAIAAECWRALPDHFAHTCVDAFVVMPDHVHGIVIIEHEPDNDSDSAHWPRVALAR